MFSIITHACAFMVQWRCLVLYRCKYTN
jgi:hypothetical protein